MNLSLGSPIFPSIDGVPLCGSIYWSIQGLFIVICGIVTYFVVKINKKEQDLRKKYNVNFVESEVIFEGRQLTLLLIIGFTGGFVAGALGLGGATIYNPALLSLGVPPKVASATGMYLVLFSVINTCVVNGVSGILNFRYGLFIGAFCAVGSLVGLSSADSLVKKVGRQSILVWMLCFVFFMAVAVTPFVAISQLKGLVSQGQDITAFVAPC